MKFCNILCSNEFEFEYYVKNRCQSFFEAITNELLTLKLKRPRTKTIRKCNDPSPQS